MVRDQGAVTQASENISSFRNGTKAKICLFLLLYKLLKLCFLKEYCCVSVTDIIFRRWSGTAPVESLFSASLAIRIAEQSAYATEESLVPSVGPHMSIVAKRLIRSGCRLAW